MDARSKAAAVAACAVAVPATYVLVHALGLPMLWLDPELLKWSFGARPSPLAMDFYGRGLASLIAGGLAYALVGAWSHRRGASAWMLSGAAAVVVLALVGAAGLEIVRLLPKAQPAPIIAVARR